MWDRQGEVRGLSGWAGQMLRRSFLARAVDLDTRKYAAGERPQGGGRGVHLVKEGEDALIQTGKKQRTSDGVRLRLDLETPQGPECVG